MTITESSARPLAVITGASSGIGYELAKQFAEHDYDLLVAAEDAGITASAESLGALGRPRRCRSRSTCARTTGSRRCTTPSRPTGRPLDAIAINAGVGVGGDFTDQTELDAELDLIDLNVKSTVHLAKRVLPDMKQRDDGSVLFTSSIASTMPAPYEAVYAASKSFIQSFTEALQGELKDTGHHHHLADARADGHQLLRAGRHGGHQARSVRRRTTLPRSPSSGFEALMDGKKKVLAGGLKSKAQG